MVALWAYAIRPYAIAGWWFSFCISIPFCLTTQTLGKTGLGWFVPLVALFLG
jgi:hypothetical protein